jgi:hypothetical protein
VIRNQQANNENVRENIENCEDASGGQALAALDPAARSSCFMKEEMEECLPASARNVCGMAEVGEAAPVKLSLRGVSQMVG